MHSLIDYVAFVPNVLSSEDCDYIIDWYNENIDREFLARTGDGVDFIVSDYRTSSAIAVPYDTKPDTILSSSINKTLVAYIDTLNSQFRLKDDELWSKHLPSELESEKFIINKYSENQEYKWHTDQGYNYANSATMFARQFSIVVYLNDDFEGGETEFQFAKVTPQKGACLIFPSNFMYSHCARPVRNGVKYSCASWLAPLIEEDA